jgi:bifunctional DNA-binding transcriptional regulator/antitoxin component of YhaV-PrlF toxin-antitoxin module
MKATLSSKGQLVLPADFRERDSLRPGQVFEVERLDEGDYRLRRLAPAPNEGLVAWLRSCPGGGLPELDPKAETTDSILPDIQ